MLALNADLLRVIFSMDAVTFHMCALTCKWLLRYWKARRATSLVLSPSNNRWFNNNWPSLYERDLSAVQVAGEWTHVLQGRRSILKTSHGSCTWRADLREFHIQLHNGVVIIIPSHEDMMTISHDSGLFIKKYYVAYVLDRLKLSTSLRAAWYECNVFESTLFFL